MVKLSIKFIRSNFMRIPAEFVFLLYMALAIGRLLPINAIILMIVITIIIYKGVTYSKDIKVTKIGLWFSAIILYNLFLTVLFPNIKSLYYFFVQLLSFAFITSFTVGSMDDEYLNKLTKFFCRFYYLFSLMFILALVFGKVSMTDRTFAQGIYQALYGMSFFVMYKTKKIPIWTIWIALIPFLSGERGLSLSLIVVTLVYYIMPIISKNKFVYKFFFWIVAVFVVSFQFVYVWLSKIPLGNTLNLISRQYTNQNFFSGRQYIWGIINEYIKDSPIIGYGLGNEILSNNNIFMSAHNTYADILLSGGIISLVLFLFFFNSIWSSMFNYLNCKSIRLSMSFLIATLFFGVNGVIFVGNDTSFTLFIWLIIGIALMQRNFLIKRNKTNGKDGFDNV